MAVALTALACAAWASAVALLKFACASAPTAVAFRALAKAFPPTAVALVWPSAAAPAWAFAPTAVAPALKWNVPDCKKTPAAEEAPMAVEAFPARPPAVALLPIAVPKSKSAPAFVPNAEVPVPNPAAASPTAVEEPPFDDAAVPQEKFCGARSSEHRISETLAQNSASRTAFDAHSEPPNKRIMHP